MIDLPKKAYAYGQLVLVFEALKGDNAIVSELNLYSSNPAQLKPFGEERKRNWCIPRLIRWIRLFVRKKFYLYIPSSPIR